MPSTTAILLFSTLGAATVSIDQSPAAANDEGRVYRAACAACHGSDGRGQRRATVGFDTPLPDFTECAFTTPEPDADWIAIVHHGGPVRAFDRRMPAFGAVLSAAEIRQAIAYIRRLCRDRSWPRGELNLPRALITEKAFPENEAVLTTAVAVGTASLFDQEFLYERRLGSRSQLEVAVPIALQKDDAWRAGLGDAAFAFKQVLFHSLDAGTIISAAAEISLPTGSRTRGFGNGATVFEPFVALGQMLPSDGFIQVQGGFELPWRRPQLEREAFWRAAVGKTFVARGFGRAWTPMLEVVGAKALSGGDRAEWDAIPQMQVTLSRRQHILVNAGIRLPLTDRRERDPQVIAYLLWDWFDGGFFDGWR